MLYGPRERRGRAIEISVHAHGKGWLKEAALWKVDRMVLTLRMSQPWIDGWLILVARRNVDESDATFAVFQGSGWSKASAASKVDMRDTTLRVSQRPIGWLNARAPANV